MRPSLVEFGQVVSVDALRRRLRIRPVLTATVQTRLWMCLETGAWASLRISRTYESSGLTCVELTPGISKDMVVKLLNRQVFVAQEDCMPVEQSAPHLSETLVGMLVRLPDGKTLGEIFEVIDTPGGGAVRICLPDNRTAALPFVPQVVQSVDSVNRIVSVGEPSGYLVMDDAQPDE